VCDSSASSSPLKGERAAHHVTMRFRIRR
jgi:hypothetical protein